MLDDIKLLLGITSAEKDDLLELLISLATAEAKRISGRNETSILKNSIIKMVIYDYNRLGTEGLESESYSGVSYSYSSDYPVSVIRELQNLRKLRVL